MNKDELHNFVFDVYVEHELPYEQFCNMIRLVNKFWDLIQIVPITHGLLRETPFVWITSEKERFYTMGFGDFWISQNEDMSGILLFAPKAGEHYMEVFIDEKLDLVTLNGYLDICLEEIQVRKDFDKL